MRATALLLLTFGLAAAAPVVVHPSAAIPENLPDIAERAVKSVVNIAVTQRVRGRHGMPGHGLEFFFGPQQRPRDQLRQGQGSGVIISADGLVLTNNHVVAGAADLTVTLADGRELKAETVGTDPKTDIAVLRIKDARDLVPIELGDSHALRLGETVIAVGNPMGLGHTVTRGIVSAKGRGALGIVDYEDFIQTDAAINPGNSGGALLDVRGRLVGVPTAILSMSGGNQGIGLAVPTHIARTVADALVAHGRVPRGWLGVGIQDLDAELAKLLEVKVAKGVLITQVEPDSPAASAGLKRRDVVVALNGKALRSSADLRNSVSLTGPGKTVALAVVRGGANRTVDVELGEMPGSERSARRAPREEASEGLDGLRLSNVDREARRRFKIPREVDGALVHSVDRGSPAHRAGIQAGDVLVEINNRRVKSARDAARRLRKGAALVVINRRGRNLFLSFKPS